MISYFVDDDPIAEMQEQADADEIRTDPRGAAYWKECGRYLSAESAETLSQTDFDFSVEATERARKIQAAMVLASYWQAADRNESMQLKVGYDRSITVVNLMTGDRVRL